jgi:predicted metal-dependent phosphotriesterase family hydrolase
LISQDAGTFYFNEKNEKSTIFPFNRIFEEFIPYCIINGISHETFHKLLVENPIEVLNID